MTITTSPSLHLVFSPQSWSKAELLATATDSVIFLQDAVYLLQKPLNCQCEHVFARAKDVQARQIIPAADVEIIDDEQWLELTETANNVLSW